jgi:methanogenic corrinoid protein MtbC1
MELTDKIRESVMDMEEDRAQALVKEAIEKGVNTLDILNRGIVAGLEGVGEKFERGEYFLLELQLAGELAQNLISLVKPHLTAEEAQAKGTVVMATVKGDLHNIGKNMVTLQLSLSGYQVHDMGIDQATMDIIDRAQQVNADVIGLSALLQTTMPNQAEVIQYLKELELRERFKVIVGGGNTNQLYADLIGADGWAENAVQAVQVVNSLLGKGR